MYNWAAVMRGAAATTANPSGVQGVCPDGWHVPSFPEVKQMLDFLKTERRFWCYTGSNATSKSLCSTENYGYPSYDCYAITQPGANNSSRFTAYQAWTYNGDYNYYGSANFFTTSIDPNNNEISTLCIGWREYSPSESSTTAPQCGISVRCLKNY
jgi:uncharacterized protein (TIGR02145 family)